MSVDVSTSALPPQVQLVGMVAGLAEDLTASWSTVLADERWVEVAEALERLAVRGAVAGLADELGDAESARLAALLRQRWARVGEAAPAPAAAIVGSAGGVLTVVVDGLEPGWTASWHGPVEPVGPTGGTVRLLAGAVAPVRVGVRIFGRVEHGYFQSLSDGLGHRSILLAEAVVSAQPDEEHGSDEERHGSDGHGAAP